MRVFVLNHEHTFIWYTHTTREALRRRVFDPYAPILFNLYHYLKQNLHFGLVSKKTNFEWAGANNTGRVRHPPHSKKLCVRYGVTTMSRLLKIIGLFCRISSLLQGSFAKETCNFKEPTNRSHPITQHKISSYVVLCQFVFCIAYMHAYMHEYKCIPKKKKVHTNKYEYKHACMHSYICTYSYTYWQTCIPIYIHAYIHIYMYVHMCTYMHTHTYYTCICVGFCKLCVWECVRVCVCECVRVCVCVYL